MCAERLPVSLFIRRGDHVYVTADVTPHQALPPKAITTATAPRLKEQPVQVERHRPEAARIGLPAVLHCDDDVLTI